MEWVYGFIEKNYVTQQMGLVRDGCQFLLKDQ
jgi:hypothetical protein